MMPSKDWIQDRENMQNQHVSAKLKISDDCAISHPHAPFIPYALCWLPYAHRSVITATLGYHHSRPDSDQSLQTYRDRRTGFRLLHDLRIS